MLHLMGSREACKQVTGAGSASEAYCVKGLTRFRLRTIRGGLQALEKL